MCRYSGAGILACVLLLGSCTQYPSGGEYRLHRDMIDQPSFRPHDDPRLPVEGSIPAQGWEAGMSLEQAEQRLENPAPATPESLKTGEKLYGIYCAPCHGASGRGDGPVAAKMIKPADLTDPKYARRKDGFFYHVIRAGSGLMPPYAESLSAGERWHVVNYVRTLGKR